MNKPINAILCAASAFAISANGQETFQNLDFESAQLVFTDSPFNNLVATTNALPGWTAYLGSSPISEVAYNSDGGIGIAPIKLVGMGHGEINGDFSIWLSWRPSGGLGGGSIAQSGLVPADAQSLIFKASMLQDGALVVSLDDQTLSYTPLAVGPNYTVYGADISALADQNETLGFSAALDLGAVILDDIEFSSQPIPEPSAVALLLVGGGVFSGWFARRRTRSVKRGWP